MKLTVDRRLAEITGAPRFAFPRALQIAGGFGMASRAPLWQPAQATASRRAQAITKGDEQ
jgi:hypothetical protein